MAQQNAQYVYVGSRLLSPLADRINIPLDQVNFVASELLALVFSVCYRLYLRPRDVGATTRHAVAAGVGLVLGFFCFGNQMFHMFLQAGICYAIMKFSPPHLMHKLVFVVAMVYLAFMHIKRMSYDYGGYVLDVTGPMMISTQKVTSVAFSLHDGVHKKEESLSADQKHHAIRRRPSLLEYVSYVFNFQGLLAGPLCFYRDYIDFIGGYNTLKYNGNENERANSEEPNPTGAVIEKLLFAGLCLFITLCITPYALKVTNAEPDFIRSHSFLYRFVFMLISVTLSRPKYYFAWKFAEAINNAAGFGFNGYDDQGKAKWDLVKNVSVRKLETATSLKVLIESWNIQTAIWLRRICYERVRVQRTALTYVLSAFWHGFYPGYYLAFLGAAFFTPAARAVRRNVRPYFLGSKSMKLFYDCVTWFFAQLTLAYLIIPFTVLQFWPCFNFYTYSMYWWMHIVVGITLLCLPSKPSSRSGVKNSDKVMDSDNNQVHSEDKAKQQ